MKQLLSSYKNVNRRPHDNSSHNEDARIELPNKEFSLKWTRNSDTFSQIGRQAGTDKMSHHGYYRFYPRYLEGFRQTCNAILEIGIDQSASLELWKSYFPKAKIYGIDIDISSIGERHHVFKADQSDIEQLVSVKERIGHSLPFIIDDGSHIPEHQILTLEYFFKSLLEPNGIYVIEDIETSYWSRNGLYGYSTRYGYKHPNSLIEAVKCYVSEIVLNLDIHTNNSSNMSSDILKYVSMISIGHNCMIFVKKGLNSRKRLRELQATSIDEEDGEEADGSSSNTQSKKNHTSDATTHTPNMTTSVKGEDSCLKSDSCSVESNLIDMNQMGTNVSSSGNGEKNDSAASTSIAKSAVNESEIVKDNIKNNNKYLFQNNEPIVQYFIMPYQEVKYCNAFVIVSPENEIYTRKHLSSNHTMTILENFPFMNIYNIFCDRDNNNRWTTSIEMSPNCPANNNIGSSQSINNEKTNVSLQSSDESLSLLIGEINKIKLDKYIFMDNSDNNIISEQNRVRLFDNVFRSCLNHGGSYVLTNVTSKIVSIFSNVFDTINIEFLHVRNREEVRMTLQGKISEETYQMISSITFGQGCILVTKKTYEEIRDFNANSRIYRFRNNL